MKSLWLATLLCIPTVIFAAEEKQQKPQMSKPQGLSLGLGAVASSGIYVGEKTEIIPIPAISYETDQFFIRGLYAGAAIYKNQFFTVNGIANVNMMNLDVDDLDAKKLAERNINRSQLEDRDRSIDVGLESILRMPYGLVSFQAVNDVGGASEGAELRFNYQYFWRVNPKLTITPNVGVDWLSNKRSNYYYGILDREVDRGVESYKPNDVFIPHIGLGSSYVLTDKTRVSGIVMHKFLPNKVQDSPLIDQDSSTSAFVAISYKF